MGKKTQHRFQSEGDFEALILHENMKAFAAIVNKDLYMVTGKPPDQNIYFHNSSAFDLFCIHVFEVFVEQEIQLKDTNSSFSLFTGAKWLADRYECQLDITPLKKAIKLLTSWLEEEPMFSFWCSDISRQIEFKLSRRELLRFSQLFTKHNLLRLSDAVQLLLKKCNNAGCSLQQEDVLHLLEPFIEELKTNRLIYHSSYLVEMLHIYFTELNNVAYALCLHSPTTRMNDMKYPDGLSCDTFKELYFSAVRFAASYNKAAYDALRPHTTEYLKMRY
jgi:hypothetical protein